MSFRRTLLAASVLALALVLDVGAAASAPASTGPTNLRITATSSTSISLAWDAAKKGGSNWWYCVQNNGLGCFRVDPPRTTFTYSSLWPGTTYNFSVVAVDMNGRRSASSNTVTFTTPPDTTPPSAPTLTATVYPMRAALSWTNSVDNRTQVWYTILVDGTPYLIDQFFTSATVFDLSPSTTYAFQVTARDYFGNTAGSNILNVTTPAATNTTPPTAPANLRLGPESGSEEIWLEWDPSTDDADLQSEILYEIFINGQRADRLIGGTNTIAYCPGPGPFPIAVRAVDTSGNASAFSNQVFWC